MGYKRPASTPVPDTVPYLACLPDSSEWRTLVWGAMHSLTDEYRREGTSALTDEEITQEFVKIINSFERATMYFAGIVSHYAGTSIPQGWLEANGQSVSADDYPELFGVIGHTYGGSGTNFNLPDLREKFIYGAGNGVSVGANGGAATHTLTINEMPRHNHQIKPLPYAMAQLGGGDPIYSIVGSTDPTSYTGGDAPHNNIPPYVALKPIICTGRC